MASASRGMGGAKQIAVIGAGATGLVTAYRLLQRGYGVRVFEGSGQSGGLVRTFEVGGERLECFYHHLFASDTAAIRLISELGLEDTLEWRESTTGVFLGSHVYPFTSAWDLLRFSPLPPLDRLRLGLMALDLRGEADGSQFEGVTAVEWLRRHGGRRALETVWGPLLRGKFGEGADEVEMTWLWHKVRTRFSSRKGRFAGRELLGYQRGSFARWVEALANRVSELGGRIELGRLVRRIAPGPDGLTLEVSGPDETVGVDAAVVTAANSVFLRLVPGLPESFSAQLEATRYQDALCLVLALERPLTRHYWLNVADPETPFVAVVEQTNLVDADRYGGRHIVYLSNYLDADSPRLGMDAGQAFEYYAPHLKRINPRFDESWVEERWLFHGRDAQPVFTVGAASRIPDHRTPLGGLYLANMAQIYPQDRGQNYAIALGERVAAMVASDLEQAPRYQV